VFESNLCSSGSLRGVIHASNYNRAWGFHSGMFDFNYDIGKCIKTMN
jgi:hypothetical protein